MSFTKKIFTKINSAFFVAAVSCIFFGGVLNHAEAATSAQVRKACKSYNSAIKAAEKQKVDVKDAKKTYKKICDTPTVKTSSQLQKDIEKLNSQTQAIKKKTQNKKKYNEECKTAAAKKTPKCEKLATAAGVVSSSGVGGSAGSTIKKCGGVATAFNYGCDGADSKSGGNDNPIFQVLFFIVNIVALGVGMVAVGGVIYGAILYTSAGDNGEQTKKGIHIIVNAVLGVTLFAFMYAILNFLVPGGLFT